MRKTLNEGLPIDEQVSLNDMLLKAAALASEKVPDVSPGECAAGVLRLIVSGLRITAVFLEVLPMLPCAGFHGVHQRGGLRELSTVSLAVFLRC